MAEQINPVQSIDGDSSSVLNQWLELQEGNKESSISSIDAGSITYQLEMNSAFNSLMSGSNEIQKQAEENAKESQSQAPVVSF